MNSAIFFNGIRFIILVLAQALIFNHINFLGYINPYPYLLFIALLPLNTSKTIVLLFSFFMGFAIDVFSDGGGVNTIACLITAYIRPVFLKTAFGIGIDYNAVKIEDTGLDKKIIYFALLILTHHFIVFSLEIFSFTQIESILKNTLYSGVFTLVLSLLFISIFNRKRS